MYFTQAFKARCIYSSLDVGLQSALFIDRYSVVCVSVFNRNPESLEKGRYGRGKGDAHEAVMGRPALDHKWPYLTLRWVCHPMSNIPGLSLSLRCDGESVIS